MRNMDTVHVINGKRYLFAVEVSQEKDDYRKYEELRQEIWKEPIDHMGGERNLLCENYFDMGSSLFTGVFVEDEKGGFRKDSHHLVGFSYGFVGVRDKELGFRSLENFIFYSQYLGVKKKYQDLGLGRRIKEFQRRIVRDVFGVWTIACTFDPLVGVNASRNIHRFGMDIIGYEESFYKDFGGELNRTDIPSDRLCASWDLSRDIERPEYGLDDLVASGHSVILSEISELQGRNGPVCLEVVTSLRFDWDREFVLVEIPYDFYAMLRETDVSDKNVRKIPLEWRMATRKAFQELFERRYNVIDFRTYRDGDRKRDYYILKRGVD